MMNEKVENNDKNIILRESLKINCMKCSGLCCVALYCMKTDGFPANKEAGIPCRHLMADFRCDIHSKLVSKNMRGCLAYDCFGAGQKVSKDCYPNEDWSANPEKANDIFNVFLTILKFNQMAWYLLDALSLTTGENLKKDIEALISEYEQQTNLVADEILYFDIENYQARVNDILKQVIRMTKADTTNGALSKNFLGKNFKNANLSGKDFSMALLIAANLEGLSLQGTNFLGADMRDANLMNADLSSSTFLTQMQINSAKGNINTKLPKYLSRPATWQC